MKDFRIQRLAGGEHKGKLGIFDGDDLIGIGSFVVEMSSADLENLAFLAESGSHARSLLAERIRERMVQFNESYALAELHVVRTNEGRILWEQARAERLGR